MDGPSDALVDALVLHGSADVVAARLAEHFSAGADHVAAPDCHGFRRGG
jgi:hypothetical protein